jgi:uncharacterized protein YkwD
MRNSRRLSLLLAVGAALAVAAFVSLLLVGQSHVRGQTPLLSEDETALLALINDYRLEHGLSTLKVSPTLSDAARWMSEDMAEHDRMGHTDSLGRGPSERLVAFGYTQASMWGEIIQAGSSTPQGAFEGWRSSPGHNATMLADGYVVAGVGKAYNPQSLYGWFWTVDFGDYDDSGVPLPTPTSVPTPKPTPTPTPTPTATPEAPASPSSAHPGASQDTMHNCPQAGKWAISVWGGADGTATDQAVASCTGAPVAAAYWIDPQTQVWLHWFPGQPGMNSLTSLDHMQAIIAFGGQRAQTTAPLTLTCTHHVAPNGNDDNPGTADAPWHTIQHAADTAQPGDTVCFGTGSYSEDVTFSRSGTADAAITFAAAPDETATVQGSLTLAPGTSYLNLIGFDILGFPVWGVTLEGDNHHVLLSHLDVAGGEASVRFTVGYSGEAPEHGSVSDVVVEDSVLSDSKYAAADCTPGPCDRMIFRRLEIYGAGTAPGADFGGDGLAVERGQDILVEDSYVHDNGGDGIDLNSRDSTGNVAGIVVRRDRVVRNHLQGIKLWAGGRMENNVVWGQGINPVVVGVYPGDYQVVNNTIAYNMYSPDYGARDYAFVAAYPENGTSAAIQLTLVNNIFAFNTGPEQGSPTGLYLGQGVQLTEHHNLYWSREDGEIEAEFVSGRDPSFTRAEIADGTWAAVTGQGQGDVTADPLFVSGWSEVDLHLQASSPAVNAGCTCAAPLRRRRRPPSGHHARHRRL